MKRINVFVIFCLLFGSSFAQDAKLEVIPGAGYTFSGRTNWGTMEMNYRDNYSAQLALDVRVHQNMLVELLYYSVASELDATVYNGFLGREFRNTPVTMEYYQIGGIREVATEKVRPFTAVTLGATRFHPTGDTKVTSEAVSGETTMRASDIWSLSATLGLGAKIMFSQRVGLRLQGRLMLPMYFSGIGIYCGSGCGGGASFGVYFPQLDFSGGIVIGLGDY